MIKLSTLSSRLALWYSAAFAVVIGIIFLIFYVTFNQTLMARMDADLLEDIEEYQQLLSAEGIQGIHSEILRESKELNESEKAFIRLLDLSGQETRSTDLESWSAIPKREDLFQALLEEGEPILYTFEIASQDAPTRAIYGKLSSNSNKNSKTQVVIHMGESLEEQVELMDLLLVIIGSIFIIALPVTSYIGWLMAQRAVSGINQVSKIAREIEYGALDRRVAGKMWGDEIQQLATTFNSMLDKIHELILEMRELTDNVAHDLRSPLARIRVIAEASVSHNKSNQEHQSAAADIIDECDRLMEMINASLDLAELEAGVASIQKSKVNLTELVSDACELFHPLAEEKNLHLNLRKKTESFVLGDIQSLQRMLANLLDNAIKYTPENGHIDVDLISNDKSINVIVADTGIGISPQEQRRVFERFYRCDQNRLEKGCGLGLSFAQAVARAHGGEIDLNSQYGQGSAFRVRLDKYSTINLN